MTSNSADNQDEETDVEPSQAPAPQLSTKTGTTISLDDAIAAIGTTPLRGKPTDWKGPAPVPFAKSMNVRVGLAIYGILIPIVCHILTQNGGLGAEWQSGKLQDKLGFVLSGECGWPILPFLAHAMICLSMVIRNETWAFSKSWVRFGIYSGAIVCGYYLLAFSLTVMDGLHASVGLLIGAIAWLLVIHSSIWFLRTMTYLFDLFNLIPLGVTIVGGTLLLTILCVVIGNSPTAIFFVPSVLILILSTPLAFLSYLGISIRILKLHTPAHRFTMAQLMIWVTWLVTFMSALRKTVELSFAKYAQLPLEPTPECYVATAASKGYPSIVGSQSLPTATAKPMIVNTQLATFKAAELTLRTVSPNGHRVFRFLYDRLGPPAAAMLGSPLIATAAYLCLKPAEWLCWIVLRMLLGRKTFQLAQRLYHSRAKHIKP